jgi:hypothetical protein
MLKGAYHERGDWSAEQDEFLKQACTTKASYDQIRMDFNREFPDDRKSRSALIGRARRKGYANGKPPSSGQAESMVRTKEAMRARGQEMRKSGPKPKPGKAMVEHARRVKALEDDVLLRDENDMGARNTPKGSTAKRRTKVEIEKAREGRVIAVVDQVNETSVNIHECPDNGCRWPTKDEIGCMEVCGAKATVGAYCGRHAQMAYRVMPTRRRNAEFSRRGLIDSNRARIANSHVVQELENEFLQIAPDDDDDVLLLPHFIGEVLS